MRFRIRQIATDDEAIVEGTSVMIGGSIEVCWVGESVGGKTTVTVAEPFRIESDKFEPTKFWIKKLTA